MISRLKRIDPLFLIPILISASLSLYVCYRTPIVNPDGICYLLSAEQFSKDLSHVMHSCGQARWPIYSMLIYLLAKVIPFSYETVAYCINIFFTLLSISFFILINKALGGSRFTQWLAAAVILLAHDFNRVREYIIRDHAFWFFYLFSLWCLIKLCKHKKFRYALGWNASILLATAFRVEGIMFILLIPPLLLIFPENFRFKQFFQLNMLTALFIVFFATWLILHPNYSLNQMARFGDINQALLHGFHSIYQRFSIVKQSMIIHVLPIYSIHQAGWLVLSLFVIWYIVSLISSLSWPYALLLGCGFFLLPLKQLNRSHRILLIYFFVNLIITSAFLLQYLFLSNRYMVAMSLTLMVYLPFIIEKLLKKINILTKIHQLIIIVSSLIIIFIGLWPFFHTPYSKKYIYEAGRWMSMNIPKNASLFVNDFQLMYYSKHFDLDIFNQPQTFFNPSDKLITNVTSYHFVALKVPKELKQVLEEQIKNNSSLSQIKKFNNPYGDSVIVFQIKN